MEEGALRYAAVCAAGLLAGVVNTLAGGGSFLTLPALIYLGLPADVANGTNRIGVLLQNVTAALAFRRQGFQLTAWGPLFWSLLGAGFGVTAAAVIDAEVLEPVFGALMLMALPLLFVRLPAPRAGEPASSGEARRSRPGSSTAPAAPRVGSRRITEALGLFAAGFYGGFIQAGVGVILLLVLVGVRGLSVRAANPVKVLLVAVFTVPAVFVFTLQSKMDWGAGAVLAVGTTAGAALGAHLPIPTLAIKILVAVLVLLAGADLLFR